MRTLRYYSAAAACIVFGYILWELVELLQAPGEPKPEALPKLLTALVITAMAAYQFDKNHPQFMALIFAVGATAILPWHFKIFGAAPLTLLVLQAIGRRDEPFAKRFSSDPPGPIDKIEKVLTLFVAGVFLLVQHALWRNLPASISPIRPENTGYWVLLSLPVAYAVTCLVHELGHALAGFLVGYRLTSLESYPLSLQRDRPGLKIRIDWALKTDGSYFGTPTRVSRLALRECVVVAGGPAAGLILVL